MRVVRIVLAVVGVGAAVYGISTIANAPATLIGIGIWMVAAVIIHDGVLSPLVLLMAAAVEKVPTRARRFLQVALIMAAAVTVIAVPMIIKQGTFPPSKALLRQNYGVNLAILLALIGFGTLAAYAVHVTRRTSRSTPPANDHG